MTVAAGVGAGVMRMSLLSTPLTVDGMTCHFDAHDGGVGTGVGLNVGMVTAGVGAGVAGTQVTWRPRTGRSLWLPVLYATQLPATW